MCKSIITTCAISLSVAIVACGGGNTSSETTEVVGSNPESIINGAETTVDFRGSPLVLVPGLLCSGTLLSDQWLLTAHHCATKEDVRTGGTPWEAADISVYILNGGAALGAQVFLHPSADVALVRLDRSLLGPSGRPFANPLYLGSVTGLVPGPVVCEGWGKNTSTGGEGMLRYAFLNISSANASSFQIRPNGLGQILGPGDSGSACFHPVDGELRVIGVMSTGYAVGGQPQYVNLVSVDAFRDWAEGIMGNAATVFENADFSGRAQALMPKGPLAGSYDYARLLVGNDVISSLTVPALWNVSLYRDGGFNNFMRWFTATTANVGGSYNDKTSSAQVYGGIAFYEDEAMQQTLGMVSAAGRTTLWPGANNTIRAMAVPMGWRIELFDNSDFTGASVVFHEGTYHTLGDFNFVASSVIVEQPVEVYADGNFNGAIGRLLPGCYDWNQLGVPNESISSIYVPTGMGIQVYRDANFGALSDTFTTSQSTLPSLNDQISSVCVFRN